MGARRGISGGEKKRLSVSTELLTIPSVIFADEPTSGLDAFMAESVVTVLQRLATEGRTIITTIHQPSTEVFEKFTKLMLLSEGRIVYFGPRAAAVPWFMRLGCACPPYANPADFFIELLAIPSSGTERANKVQLIDGWIEAWNTQGVDFLVEWNTSLQTRFEGLTSSVAGAEVVAPPVEKASAKFDLDIMKNLKSVYGRRSYPANFWTQFCVLTGRASLHNRRNPLLFHARLVQTVVTALIAGFVYFRLSSEKVMSKNGACFFLILTQGMAGTMGVIQVSTGEAPVALREYYSGTYNILAYFWAKLVSDLPFQVFNPILFTCIAWFLIGLNDSGDRFGIGLLIIFLATNSMISLGYVVSAASRSMAVAVAINPIVIMPMSLVSGFMIILNTLPGFWIWLVYMSPVRWAWSGLMHATWVGVDLEPCTQEPPECFYSGAQVLDYYAIASDTVWGDAVALIIQIVVYRLVAMFVLLARCSLGKKV
eukprot:GHVS01058143.1.p1 GENE.GHVS01058143.1~~GHVS01058143.1.p1  ORF type:complete len:483 (-),score=52.12 GHVS01058143.1:89-1537(-)